MINHNNTTAVGIKERFGALGGIATALTMVLGGLLMIIGSKLRIEVKPVPFTGQTMSVLLIALTMNPLRAFGSVFLWICMGALGIPVFASSVVSSSALVGPTAGYIFGMLAAVTVASWLNQHAMHAVCQWLGEKWGASQQRAQWMGSVAIGLVSDTLILSCGWAYLSTFVGPYQAWLVGVAPYLMWDLVKILTTSVVVSSYGLRHKLSQL